MNSFQLKSELEYFFESFQEFQPFLKVLKIFSDYANEGMDTFRGIGTGQNISQAASNLHQRIANVGGLLPQIKNRAFFDSQKTFVTNVKIIKKNWPESSGWLDKIIFESNEFVDLYDNYVNSRNIEEAFALTVNANVITRDIDGMLQAFDAFFRGFTISEPINGISSLTLYFPGNISVLKIILKLHAIDSIYTEACNLLNISLAEYPLSIGKLESGSFWVNLVGSAIVMTAMTTWLENGAMFIYRTAITEGKIVSISKKADSVETMLGLRKSLADANIDTSLMDEHIKKTAVKIAAELEILVTEQSIKINNDVFSIQNEFLKLKPEGLDYVPLKQIEMVQNRLSPPMND